MSTVAISNHYISPGACGMMYGQQGSGAQGNIYDPKIYDSSKIYGESTSNTNAAAAYTPWQTPFKYTHDSLTTNWPSTANAWSYGHQTPGISLGHIVKPELQDYTR